MSLGFVAVIVIDILQMTEPMSEGVWNAVGIVVGLFFIPLLLFPGVCPGRGGGWGWQVEESAGIHRDPSRPQCEPTPCDVNSAAKDRVLECGMLRGPKLDQSGGAALLADCIAVKLA